MTEVTTVSFAVPSEHALEFQTRAFMVLAELTAQPHRATTAGFTPLSSSEVQGTDVWRLPEWQADDHDRAAWVVDSLPEHPRAVLHLLVRNAGRWVSGMRIAEELGFEHGAKSVPPSFKSMANRCRRGGRRPIWDYDAQKGYLVSPLVAELFLDELEDRGDDPAP
jgi:hypothetical protein